jgi:hypothetical protein
MNGEYWPTRQTISTITARPAIPAMSSSTRAGSEAPRRRRLGQIIASAAPSRRPPARVSVPS